MNPIDTTSVESILLTEIQETGLSGKTHSSSSCWVKQFRICKWMMIGICVIIGFARTVCSTMVLCAKQKPLRS